MITCFYLYDKDKNGKDSCGGRCGQLLVLTWHTVFRRDDKTLSNFFIIATTEIINVIIIITMTMIQHHHPLFCLGITTFHHLQPRLLTICLHTHCYKGNLVTKWEVLGEYLGGIYGPLFYQMLSRSSSGRHNLAILQI